jgi:ribose 5-phosphate isomerase B
MKIYITNDHTGVAMKNAIVTFLENDGHEVINLGTDSSEAVNYADYGKKLGLSVAGDKGSFGIAICGTGIGISIAANKVKGVIAGLVYEPQNAAITRQHNNANVMATGARQIAIEKAILCVKEFINTPFEGGRHEARVNELLEMKGETN